MKIQSFIFNTGEDGRISTKPWVYPALAILAVIGSLVVVLNGALKSCYPKEPEVVSIRFSLESPTDIQASWVDKKLKSLEIVQEKEGGEGQ